MELAVRYRSVASALPPQVQLIAVSKKRTIEEIKALYDLGHRAFGENYPQEIRDKQPVLPKDIEWHFIGHLQTNKVKYIAPFAHLVHGVDSEKLLDELDKRAAALGRVQDVLLQVHIALEEAKHGFTPEELRSVWDVIHTSKWPALRFRGLMGMATNTGDRERIRSEYDGLAALFQELKDSNKVHQVAFDTLSMGMSGDLDLAVEAGSTMVRIGTAIFGERD